MFQRVQVIRAGIAIALLGVAFAATAGVKAEGAEVLKALRAYDPDGTNKSEAAVQLMSDQAMVEPARLLARLAAGAQPTYAYRLSYVACALRAREKGALHARSRSSSPP